MKKVISGGQSGIDRMGLEVAKALGLATGGLAPLGWRTEGGPRPELGSDFGLTQHTNSDYSERTEQNVLNSDLTVILGNTTSAGSAQTIRYCRNRGKPFVCNPTSQQLLSGLYRLNVQVLNVAGNRASRITPDKLKLARTVLEEALAAWARDEETVAGLLL